MAERHIPDPEAMAALGAELAPLLTPPCVVTLSGPLGAGKTELVRACLRGLGHDGPVRSPTYTLVETYPLDDCTIHHLDLYRLGDPEELELIGARDLASADAVWLIEWPDRGGDRLPPPDLAIAIEYDGAGRRISGLPDALAQRA